MSGPPATAAFCRSAVDLSHLSCRRGRPFPPYAPVRSTTAGGAPVTSTAQEQGSSGVGDGAAAAGVAAAAQGSGGRVAGDGLDAAEVEIALREADDGDAA